MISRGIFTRFRGAARPLMQPCGLFRTNSSCRQQSRQPDKIVSCGLELKRPVHPRHTAEFGLRHAATVLIQPFASSIRLRMTWLIR